MASAKQIAARKKFAQMAKSKTGKVGAQAAKKGTGAKKPVPAFLKGKKGVKK